jgi:hypothetical protein
VDGLAEPSPSERYLIEKMRAAAASGTDDFEVVARSIERILATAVPPVSERLNLQEVLASTYFRLKKYELTATSVQAYFNAGGTKQIVRLMEAQSDYLMKDYANAVKVLARLQSAQYAAGVRPSKAQLEMGASAYSKLADEGGYRNALVALIREYPSREYWSDLLARLDDAPGFQKELKIDLRRLQFHVGAFSEADDYVEFAGMLVKTGFPAEAVPVLAQGFSLGFLGRGPRAAQHLELQAQVSKLAVEDATTGKQRIDGPRLATGGDALFKSGYNLTLNDQVDLGLKWMEQGLSTMSVVPEIARLRLGVSYLIAGRRNLAEKWIGSITQSNAAQELGQLWLLTRGSPDASK